MSRTKKDISRRFALVFALGGVAAVTVLLLWTKRHQSSSNERPSPAVTSSAARPEARPPRSTPRSLPALSPPAPEPGTLPTDPDDPDYDAYALMRAMRMDPKSLFDRERRDPVWAPAVEARIRDTLRSDFSACFPNREPAVTQECHSSTCIVTVEVPYEFSRVDKDLAHVIPQMAKLGDGIRPDSRGNVHIFAMAMAKDRHNLEQFDAKMAEARGKLFEAVLHAPEPAEPDAFLTAIRTCLLRIAENRKRDVAPPARRNDVETARPSPASPLRAAGPGANEQFPRVKPDFSGELALKDPALWSRYAMMLNPLKEYLTRIAFQCVARSEPPSTIRFVLRVSTREREVVIEPTYVGVAKGAPLSPRSTDCIADGIRAWTRKSVATAERLSRLPDFDVEWLVSVGNPDYDPARSDEIGR